MNTTAGVVVHHRSLDTVIGTVESLLRGGLDPSDLVVVDNSDDDAVTARLLATSPVRVIVVPNHGFGSAANAGIEELLTRANPPEFVLICTHEVVLPEDGPGRLAAALEQDPRLGLVAPAFRHRRSGRPWSYGGTFTRTGRPVHRLAVPPNQRADCIPSHWTDGACGLYRREAILTARFDPDYFMYFEEVDLHRRIEAAGWRIAVDGSVLAEQDTHGTPAFWAGRNMILYGVKHLSGLQRLTYWAAATVRAVARYTVRDRRPGETVALIKGIGAGLARMKRGTEGKGRT